MSLHVFLPLTIESLPPSLNIPNQGPRDHRAEKSYPYCALSEFLKKRICEQIKVIFYGTKSKMAYYATIVADISRVLKMSLSSQLSRVFMHLRQK